MTHWWHLFTVEDFFLGPQGHPDSSWLSKLQPKVNSQDSNVDPEQRAVNMCWWTHCMQHIWSRRLSFIWLFSVLFSRTSQSLNSQSEWALLLKGSRCWFSMFIKNQLTQANFQCRLLGPEGRSVNVWRALQQFCVAAVLKCCPLRSTLTGQQRGDLTGDGLTSESLTSSYTTNVAEKF